MAIPIAVAGADQGGGAFVPVALFAYVAAPFNVPLSDNGSFDPDAGAIVAWSWTLTYKPPGSAATLLNPLTATPTLQNVDVVGTYRVFLEVTDDNLPPEDSEPDVNLAPNSAFCKVVHKTQVHDWRIPASGERTWADVVYDMWTQIDSLLPATSQWDITHQLFFAAGNTAQIRDNRVAATKGGEQLLWLNSATGVDTAAGVYYGLRVTPGRQMTGLGEPTVGTFIEDMDTGIEVVDPWRGDCFVSIWETDPAVLASPNCALRMEQRHVDHDGGNILEYYHTDVNKLGTNMVVDQAKAMVQTWGTTGAIWVGPFIPYFLGAPRLFLTELTFDHRTTAPTYNYSGAVGDEGGTIKWYIDAETVAAATAQDIVLGRIVRQKPVADDNGEDFGIVWRESVAELAAVPPDLDLFPSRTLLMRRPDEAEWSFPGVQRARVGKDPVPFERPGWIQGQLSDENPPIDDATEWTVAVNLPATVSVDLSEGGGWSNARAERPVLEWSAFEGDFVIVTYMTAAPDRIQIRIKYAQPYATESGQATHVTAGAVNGNPYSGTVDLVALGKTMKIGPNWAETLSIQLTPYMDGALGSFPPVGDIPIMSVDELVVDGSNNLTSFTYIIQPREDDHAILNPQKFFWQVQVEKRFYTTDKITELHWSALVTVVE